MKKKAIVLLGLWIGILWMWLPVQAMSVVAQQKNVVESRYGITIKMDQGYLDEAYCIDTIDKTFAKFPKGLVKEITDYYKAKGITTKVHIQYKQTALGGSFGIVGKTATINVYPNPIGNAESVTLAHEMGHYLHKYLQDKGSKEQLKADWIKCNEAYAYTDKKWTQIGKGYEKYFLNAYSTQSYSEDFATLLEYLVGAPSILRDTLMTGNAGGIQKKIEVLNKYLLATCKSITNTQGIWGKALPQVPSAWAKSLCNQASEKGLIPAANNITHPSFEGLYTTPIYRYEFCRLVENLIEQMTNQPLSELAFSYGKKQEWYEHTTLDIQTMESKTVGNLPFKDTGAFYVFDLYAMGIIGGTGDKTFSPNDTLTTQQVAIILERTAKVLGISDFDQSSMLQQMQAEKEPTTLCTYEQAYIAILDVFSLK